MTGISWTDETWNPTVGCSIVSPGCTNCYAMKMAARLEAMGTVPHYGGTTRKVNGNTVWTGKINAAPDEILLKPLRWKKPRKVFVNSMSDLFADEVSDEVINRVFAVMACSGRHTFQVLTKRPDRMSSAIARMGRSIDVLERHARAFGYTLKFRDVGTVPWPLPNVWLGVSAEDQARFDQRAPVLRTIPAAVRFVSFEPLLNRIDGGSMLRFGAFQWAIIGGESGPGARDCWVPDVRRLTNECRRAGMAVFVKQLGARVTDRNDAGFDGCEADDWPHMDPDDIEHDINGYHEEYQGAPVRIHLRDRKGADMAEWPADLRVRQWPMAPQ